MSLAPLALALRVEETLGKAQYRALTSLVRRLTGVRRESVKLGGCEVPFFYRPGKGSEPPIVLVHGFGGDKEGWLMMASFLRKSRGLVIPDLPGFGGAGTIPREHASAQVQAKALADLLTHLGIERAHLVGNSMGGGIALRFAADFPTRTSSLTLIGSVGPIVEKSEVALALDRGENPLIIDSPADLERLLHLVAERLPPAPRAMRRYLGAERYGRRDAQAILFDGWHNPADGHGVPTDLAAIDTPTLVIHGDKDRVIHPATGRALASGLKNARLEALSGIGHVPMLEAPKRTAELVESFVDSVSTLSRSSTPYRPEYRPGSSVDSVST